MKKDRFIAHKIKLNEAEILIQIELRRGNSRYHMDCSGDCWMPDGKPITDETLIGELVEAFKILERKVQDPEFKLPYKNANYIAMR